MCFHCCNNSCLHKFIAISATDGFNFPISLYDPIHLIYLILCFIWDKVLIPGCWIFTFWWGQFWYQDLEKFVTSVPVFNTSIISIQFTCIFCLCLWIFIVFWQRTCAWSLLKFLLYLLKLLCTDHIQRECFNNNLVIALWVRYPDVDWMWLILIWYWVPAKGPLGISQWQRVTLHIPIWYVFISPMTVFATSFAYSRTLDLSVWIISWKKLSF